VIPFIGPIPTQKPVQSTLAVIPSAQLVSAFIVEACLCRRRRTAARSTWPRPIVEIAARRSPALEVFLAAPRRSGDKNSLFVGHDEAGENLAGLYSLVATCEANGVNPFDCLADVLICVQSHAASRIDELLRTTGSDRRSIRRRPEHARCDTRDS
jgi:IS66 C-terminal element